MSEHDCCAPGDEANCTCRCHDDEPTRAELKEELRENEGVIKALRRQRDEAEAEIRRLQEGLKRLAGIPDQHGVTYGSTLHDVGKMMIEAEAILNGTTSIESLLRNAEGPTNA
jgi:hypothetical protein